MFATIFAKTLNEAIQLRAAIPYDEIEELLAKTRNQKFLRGENFIRQGNLSASVGFVEKGLFKAFGTSKRGMTYIRNFCSQGYFIASYASAIQSAPADMTIQALEDSTVLTIDYAVLNTFFERSKEWQKFARVLAENHYIEREMKEYRLLTLSASERYALFLAENSHLAGRVSQANIASYIGVTPEALSRALKKEPETI